MRIVLDTNLPNELHIEVSKEDADINLSDVLFDFGVSLFDLARESVKNEK